MLNVGNNLLRDLECFVNCKYFLECAGSILIREMIWFIANNLDFDRAKLPIGERFPYFEYVHNSN